MEHTTIAVDLAESVFQVAISHRAGRVDTTDAKALLEAARRKIRRRVGSIRC